MRYLLSVLIFFLCVPAFALNKYNGVCSNGAIPAKTNGLNSSNTLQSSYPQCSVLVSIHGAVGVFSVSINNPGSGQTNGTYILNGTGGGGSGAQVQITVSGGKITLASVFSQGSGYTSAPSFVISEGGTPGTLTAVLGPVLAVIYADNNPSPTPLANPFTALSSGSYGFYTNPGEYDVTMSGGFNGGFPSPYTLADIVITSASSGGGGLFPGPQFHIIQYAFGGIQGTPSEVTTDSTGDNINVPGIGAIFDSVNQLPLVDTRMFGSDNSGSTDSSAAFTQAKSFAASHCIGSGNSLSCPSVYISQGSYLANNVIFDAPGVFLVLDPKARLIQNANGGIIKFTASNSGLSGGILDGGGFIGVGNVTSVSGNGATVTYSYTLSSGVAGQVANNAIVSGCRTSSAGGFNGIFPITTTNSGSFTISNTTIGTESESGCAVQFMYGGNALDAESVNNVNINGTTVQYAGDAGIIFNNSSFSSVTNSNIIKNGRSGVAVSGTGIEGMIITGDTFDCRNVTNQDNDCLSFKASPPTTAQYAHNNVESNIIRSSGGFGAEIQYIGVLNFSHNTDEIYPTPIISSAFPGFAIFSGFSVQHINSTYADNTVVNLTGQPADFPLHEHFGWKNSLHGNHATGGDVFLYDVESTFNGNQIVLGQLVIPNGNETGNPVATGLVISDNEINTSCAKPGQAWTANTKLQLGYCIVDSFNSIWITVSDHAAANMTGTTNPFTAPHLIGTQITEGNSITWQNYGQQLYGDAGSTGSVSNVVASGGTASFTYSIISGSSPSIGNSAVVAGCTTAGLNGIQTVTATGSGVFSTSNPTIATESESSCRVTFTQGRKAINISCNSSGLTCSDIQIHGNTLIDNYSTKGIGISVTAATGATANNLNVQDNNFIGFTNCYSLSPASSATAILYNNREHNCTSIGTINQASHISLEQLIETTQKNFVPNSGFKFSGAGWTINPAYTIYSGNAAEGSGQGLKYVSTGSAPAAVFAISKPITVTPGQTWTISGYIDAIAATTGSPVSIAFDRCDAGASYIQAIQLNGVSSPVSATGTIPIGVTSGCLIVSVGTAISPASSSFYISAIQMEPGSLTTFYKENDWSNTDLTIPSSVLPIATGSSLGGIKCGSGVTCAGDGTLSVSSSIATNVAYSFCSGTATSSATTLSFRSLGDTTDTCTGTAAGGAGLLMAVSGTMSKLSVRCVTTGFNASSGVFTVWDAPSGAGSSATALTVTYGIATGGTLVQDNTHTVNYAAGDLISVRFTTQATETLANCTVSFRY